MNCNLKVAGKLLKFQTVFSISHRGKFSKAINRDSKVLFGKLKETLPEKRKRQKKLEKLDKELPTDKSFYVSQESFLLKHTNKNHIRVLKFKKKTGVEEKTKEVKTEESKVSNKETPKPNPEFFNLHEIEDAYSKDFTNTAKIPIELDFPEFTKEELIHESKQKSSSHGSGDIKDESVGRIVSKSVIPSEIIVKNMLSFSIYNSTKSSRTTHKTTRDVDGIISFSQSEDTSNLGLPSVTRILSATMSEASKKALAIWKAGMIEKLGREGFDAYQKDLFKDGHDLHTSIESTLLQKEYEIPERVKPAFQSVENVLKDIQGVSALETHVVHPTLHYRGITDCVATYRGELCLIDWKKSDKRKDSISAVYDAPIQVASYIGALNSDLKYPFEIKKGLVVVAYTSGEEATVHELVQENLFIYWKAWLKRLQKYFVQLKK